jgi:predicted ATPase
MTFTSWLANLADLCVKADQIQAGLELVAEALVQVEPTGERFWEAEIWRVRGDLVLQQGPVGADNPVEAEAETCYQKAIELARGQNAKSLELRATTALARLRGRQGKHGEAHQMLSEIYGWFTEGFDTGDLRDAKRLLSECPI